MIKVHFIGRFVFFSCAFLTALPAVADYKQAYAYYKQGQFEKAIQELKPDLDKSPDWEFGHRLAGLCYLGLKNNALATVELNRAIQLKSTAFATFYGLAQAYYNTDKLDNCVQILNQGEQYAKAPEDLYDLHHLRGTVYSRQQKLDQAAADLAGAIRIKTDNWLDFSQLGAIYFSQNRYDEAVQTLQKALSLKPGDTTASGVLGKVYFKQGVAALTAKQYSQALDLLHKAATLTPNDGYIFYNTGEACLFLTNYADAEKAYTQALSLLPRNADVLTRLGLTYERQKRWAQALDAYQKANEISPSPTLKDSMTRVADQMKKPEEKKKH